jgi:TolB-like protein/Tfp pilus assembly protein PilF
MSLIKELKRRNVFRVAVAYGVVAWLLIQVGATLEPAMHLPEWTDSILAFFLLLGFPVAMFFAWAYELTPEGLKRDGDIAPDAGERAVASQKWDRLIILVMAMAIGYFALDKYVLSEPDETEVVQVAAENQNGQTVTTETPAPTEQVDADTAIPEKSIAVLPFVNMSSDPEQEYFSDGLSEELLNLLAAIEELKVAGRTSSFAFKGQNQDLRGIGEALGVAYLLEGSVRKGGNQVRITAQLIKADDGFHMWSDTWDRTLDDIFAVQDEIAATVAEQLKITLLGEAPHATVIDTRSWELTLEGRFLFNRRAPGDLERALELFEEAVEIDPNNAAAWVGAAPLYRWLFDPPKVEKTLEATEKALEIEPENPEAWARRAGPLAELDRQEEAIKAWQNAIKYGENSILVLGMRAGSRWARGDREESLAIQRHALSLDPLHLININNMAGYLNEAGRYDEAEPWALKARQLAPDSSLGLSGLFEINLSRGEVTEARNLLEQIKDRGQGQGQEEQDYALGDVMFLESLLLYSEGRIEEADLMLSQYQARASEVFPIGLAYTHSWRGEYEKAWHWLNRAIEMSDVFQIIQFVKHVYLAPLHDDPRWTDVESAMQRILSDQNWYD